MTLYSFMDVLIKLIFFIVVIAMINIWYGVFFFFLYLIMLITVYHINTGAIRRREKRREADEVVSKQMVRMIMSKQEVLQSRKIQEEIEQLLTHNQYAHHANIKTNNYLRSMFNIPLTMISITIVIVLFLAVDTMRQGTFVFADFVVMTTMVGYLTSSIMRSTETFKDIAKNFTFIQKIWNFFDTAKPMHGYNTGETFAYKTGDIVLSNISFAYDKDTTVLEDVSCHLVGGKKTALVGVSGG